MNQTSTKPFVLTKDILKPLKVGEVFARGTTLVKSRHRKDWEPAYWIAFKKNRFNKWTIRMTFLRYMGNFANYQVFEQHLIGKPVGVTGAYTPTIEEASKAENFELFSCGPDAIKLYTVKN